MSGIASVDAAVIAAGLQGKMQRLAFSKLMASTTVANVPHSLWKATGLPAVGTDPTPTNTGRTLSKTNAGAIDYLNDASSGEITSLLAVGAASLTGLGTLILCDRMADVSIDIGTIGAGFGTAADGTARMAATTAPGDGGQLWLEVTTALSAASSSVQITYTNELGTASQVTPAIATVASAIVGRSPTLQLWQTLVAGDRAVRSLTAVSSTALATGVVNGCIVRPLGYVPLIAAAQYVDRDFFVEMPSLSKIYDNACLFFIYVPTAALTATVFGELRTCAN